MANLNFTTIGQGSYKKTGPRSGKFFGPKHSNRGIKTVGSDGNMIEVEGGESVGEVNTNIGRHSGASLFRTKGRNFNPKRRFSL